MFRTKRIILITLLVVLTPAVVFSGSFVCRENISTIDKDSINIVQNIANIEAAGPAGFIAGDAGENLSNTAKDIYNVRKAHIAAASANSRAATSQAILSNAPVNFTGLEAEIFSLINSTRVSYGLDALSADQMLTDLAKLRSNDMVSRNYFSHHTPDGKNIKHIFSDYGVAYENFGENLGNASPASHGDPEAFLSAWMDSPDHRDNMLRSNYSLIGVGVADGSGRRVVTVLFIR